METIYMGVGIMGVWKLKYVFILMIDRVKTL